jgi:Fe-S oxidoreductase
MSMDKLPLVRAERLTKNLPERRRGAIPAVIDVRGLEADLRKNVEGEVRFDDGTKGLYAEDASNYRQIPLGVVIPRSREDVVQTIAACRRRGAPVLSRGGGTSLAGQTCNVAVVLDWSKYLNRILELDPGERFARVEPGVICDELVRASRPHELTYAPDPATHDHCTFGGMLGNNSCGVHAQMGGKAVDNTEELEILLYDGTWPGFEDSAVAPDKVGAYLRDLRRLFDTYGYNPSLYGHFGMGCVHCRIPFDLYTRAGVEKFKAFMDEATDLVVRYGGSFSGEHGDGQARAQFLPKMFGPELIDAFREFKAIWDPDGKMNPGKIVDPFPIDDNLRLGRGDYQPWEPETHFEYPDDHGSFAHAALRCVGIGKCRRKSSEDPADDTMCPSYMVTREELHTTRGRAHLLWEMTQKEGPIEGGWKDEHVKEALDLCLSCKGCKGECPVNVDVATYKAEFLSHYWEGRIRPRSAYAFGLIDTWARLASHVPGLANLITQLPGLRSVAKLLAGMPQERTIPRFAAEPFTTWFRKRGTRNPAGRPVLLWPDTFNNYFLPETAQAAVEVLEAFGHRVEIPQKHLCCGRPLYDQGMLDTAKRYLERVLDKLSWKQLASGCCGMAGSFGYEREKYPISIAAGERVLLPAVRAASPRAIIMTDGFSFKSQIAQETDRHALHLAEVLRMAMKQGPNAGREEYPERPVIAPRVQAQRRSMTRAGLLMGALLIGLAAVARSRSVSRLLQKPWYERVLGRLVLDEES